MDVYARCRIPSSQWAAKNDQADSEQAPGFSLLASALACADLMEGVRIKTGKNQAQETYGGF
jgi:hypothetical protein